MEDADVADDRSANGPRLVGMDRRRVLQADLLSHSEIVECGQTSVAGALVHDNVTVAEYRVQIYGGLGPRQLAVSLTRTAAGARRRE